MAKFWREVRVQRKWRDSGKKPEITENEENEEISEPSGRIETMRQEAGDQRKQISDQSETSEKMERFWRRVVGSQSSVKMERFMGK